MRMHLYQLTLPCAASYPPDFSADFEFLSLAGSSCRVSDAIHVVHTDAQRLRETLEAQHEHVVAASQPTSRVPSPPRDVIVAMPESVFTPPSRRQSGGVRFNMSPAHASIQTSRMYMPVRGKTPKKTSALGRLGRFLRRGLHCTSYDFVIEPHHVTSPVLVSHRISAPNQPF